MAFQISVYSMRQMIELLKENPINIPRVPPTDPIIPSESTMKYSSDTLAFMGKANLYLISALSPERELS